MKNYIIAALAVTNLATCARFHWQGEPYQPQGYGSPRCEAYFDTAMKLYPDSGMGPHDQCLTLEQDAGLYDQSPEVSEACGMILYAPEPENCA